MNKLQKIYISKLRDKQDVFTAVQAAQMIEHALMLGDDEQARDMSKAIAMCERMILTGRYTDSAIRSALKLRAFYQRIEQTTPNAFDVVMTETRQHMKSKALI